MSTRFVWSRSNLVAVQIATWPDDGISAAVQVSPVTEDRFWSWSGDDLRGRVLQNGPINLLYGDSYSIVNGRFVINNPSTAFISARTSTEYQSDKSKVTFNNGSIIVNGSSTKYFGIAQTSVNAFDFIYKCTITFSSGDGDVDCDTELSIRSNGSNDIIRFFAYHGGWYSADNADSFTYELGKGSAVGTVSNAAASTYPRHNYTGQITSICAIIPVLLRRCSRG